MSHKPRHIAIVMDGNGRWAKKRLLPRFAGHKAGVSSVRKVVEYCLENNIEVLTLFAFSSENWFRPESEITELMSLFLNVLNKEAKKLNENNVKLKILGDKSQFSPNLQMAIAKAEDLTQHNTQLVLNIAANYGGQWDILEATKAIASKVKNQTMTLEEISKESFENHLSTAGLPQTDLLIRTSGEQRLSNFLLWQLSYSELYFTEALWPDFDKKHMAKAVEFFSNRERRFGHTSEQIKSL